MIQYSQERSPSCIIWHPAMDLQSLQQQELLFKILPYSLRWTLTRFVAVKLTENVKSIKLTFIYQAKFNLVSPDLQLGSRVHFGASLSAWPQYPWPCAFTKAQAVD